MDIPMITQIKSSRTGSAYIPWDKMRIGKPLPASLENVWLDSRREDLPEVAPEKPNLQRSRILPIPEFDPDEFEQVFQWFLS